MHRSAEVAKEQSLDNLWLAQILFDLGGVQFGTFTVSESAVSSPVFVNPKVLISNPTALRVASKLMQQEISLAQSLRRPRVHPFGVVAGVPVGGLLLASAYSLETNIPLIYARSRPEGTGKRGIEGHFTPGDTALIIDDLITRGSSILETASLLEENGLFYFFRHEAAGHTMFIADDASVAAMVKTAVDRYDRLDAAFNNAGISPAPKPFTEHSVDEWQHVIDVNLTGVFRCMQHELRQFLAQGDGGAIVNMSSGAGVVAAPGQPQYTAAKHGVLGLTKQAAQEYMRQGIRVNAILPGMTDTPPMREYLAGNDGMVRMLPGGRLAAPEEIASAAVWLCSPSASYVSGASLVVDGGLISR